MQNIYQTFEFDRIKDSIYPYLKSERSRNALEALAMSDNFEYLESILLDLKEMMDLVRRYGDLPLSPSLDAIRLIEEAKKASILSIRDISMIGEDIKASIVLFTFFKKIGFQYPRLSNKTNNFKDLSNLKKEIDRVISPSLLIKDDASEQLKSIRNDIRKSEALLQKKITVISLSYTSYLNDENATLRDGHLVLPVKTAFKSKVPGIIYDVSDSGNTTFIEPLEIVQINNEITSLKLLEQEEIRRILKALTGLILLQEEEIIINNDVIAELDFLNAKAKYALDIDGDVASLSKERTLSLINARHPLIDKSKVIANTYQLDEEKRIVIISGPNAGGKTVSLKTVGLLVLMNQCGLALPVKEARLSLFKNIYVDIGDNQSLSDNLSTFSAHMSNIAEITNVAKGKDLVLIDELGTGTDPKEGEAIALGVVKHLEEKQIFAFISSHFEALKEYAFLSKHVMNSSMIFDETNLKPTYMFRQGTPGKSYALDAANRYGINDYIIQVAKDYLTSKGSNESDELASVLLKKINETTILSKQLEKREKELSLKEKNLEVDKANLTKKRDNLLKDVIDEKERLLQKTRKEIDSIIKTMSNSDLKLHEVIELKKKLDELENNEEIDEFNEEILIGDLVTVPSLNMSGKVISLKGKKAKISSDGGFTFECETSLLHKVDEIKDKKTKVIKRQNYEDIIKPNIPLECNLIGLHVDEAKEVFLKYIDDVRVKHYHQVRIIHGFGSGALRKMVHAYLDTQKDLTYRLGDQYEGGAGATVIIFK